jgi:hypothetical protein
MKTTFSIHPQIFPNNLEICLKRNPPSPLKNPLIIPYLSQTTPKLSPISNAKETPKAF